MEDFAKRLCRLRTEAGVTPEALGKTVGLSGRAVRNYESEGAMPKLNVAVALASYFNVSLDYLACLTDDPIPYPSPGPHEQ